MGDPHDTLTGNIAHTHTPLPTLTAGSNARWGRLRPHFWRAAGQLCNTLAHRRCLRGRILHMGAAPTPLSSAVLFNPCPKMITSPTMGSASAASLAGSARLAHSRNNRLCGCNWLGCERSPRLSMPSRKILRAARPVNTTSSPPAGAARQCPPARRPPRLGAGARSR